MWWHGYCLIIGSKLNIFICLLQKNHLPNPGLKIIRKKNLQPEVKPAWGSRKRKAELPAKRKRQYKHILESEKNEGRSTKSVKRIAMATVNKTISKKREV